MTIQEVMEFVEENDVKFIRLAFVDLFGGIKNVSIMPSQLPHALEGGISFDASSVKGFGDISTSDYFLSPVTDTMTLLPWRPQSGRVARMMCEITLPDGTPYEGYSRAVLRSQVKKAAQKGYFFSIGTEYEFYLFKADEEGNITLQPQDHAGYMDIAPLDKGENVRREICLTLENMGFMPVSSHHEQGPGQNEIDFRHAGPMHAADNAIAFKSAVRTIASLHGLCASFLPKPLPDESGNGMHINLSIEKNGANLFEPVSGVITEEAAHAMAGILKRIREISLFLNPVPSSYKRLGEFEAPRAINWSYANRSQLIRIPAAKPGSYRMELRSPDPACNPYLAFALIIAAAMEGIENNELLQDPLEVTGMLPGTLEEAIELTENSSFVRTVLPENILTRYLEEKHRTVDREKADAKALFSRHLQTI